MYKKMLAMIIIFIGLFFVTSCSSNPTEPTEYSVNLVLKFENGTIEKSLTSRTSESIINNPKDFKIFSSLISGYVVVNDAFFLNEEMTSEAYFPLKMPEADLNLYANVRPLSVISSLQFLDDSNVESYFSSQSILKDSLSEPNVLSPTSYYEIIVNSVASITNNLRYYPATKTLTLMRGYGINKNIGGVVSYVDEFNSGISIDLSSKEIKFVGVYNRVSYTNSSVGGGTVNITFNVDSISIDNKLIPLVPNYDVVSNSYTISNATNYTSMQELWESDGYDYANKCYSQFNTLLKSLSEQIIIFI
jgi:hypothetical protein